MKIPRTVLKLQSRHDFVLETATYKVQRGITQKVKIQEIWFLHSTCRLMLVNICMKFHEGILNGFQVIERTLFYFFILTDISNYRADTIDVWGDVKRYVSPYINYSAVYILFWSFEISDRNK